MPLSSDAATGSWNVKEARILRGTLPGLVLNARIRECFGLAILLLLIALLPAASLVAWRPALAVPWQEAERSPRHLHPHMFQPVSGMVFTTAIAAGFGHLLLMMQAWCVLPATIPAAAR